MGLSPTTRTDATDRAWRTLVQGLAIAAALLVWLPDADISTSEAWVVLGTTLAKTELTAVASFVMRLKVDPAG